MAACAHVHTVLAGARVAAVSAVAALAGDVRVVLTRVPTPAHPRHARAGIGGT